MSNLDKLCARFGNQQSIDDFMAATGRRDRTQTHMLALISNLAVLQAILVAAVRQGDNEAVEMAADAINQVLGDIPYLNGGDRV